MLIHGSSMPTKTNSLDLDLDPTYKAEWGSRSSA